MKDTSINLDAYNQEKREKRRKTLKLLNNLSEKKKKNANFHSNIHIYIIIFTYICVKTHLRVIECIIKDTRINIDAQNSEKREKTHELDQHLKLLKKNVCLFSQ